MTIAGGNVGVLTAPDPHIVMCSIVAEANTTIGSKQWPEM
jgi:hypothetical protein